MRFNLKINSVNTVEEVPEYWTNQDYAHLLQKFNYPDAEKAGKETLRELLLMAITDYEPNEAAAIILEYKLSEKLNEGQINQVANNMLIDKISEEYPDISLHATLYHINQLLFKAFNGKFPNTKATLIDFTIIPSESTAEIEYDKETVLRLLENGLSVSNLIKRLFTEQMSGTKPFPEAENIVWTLKPKGNENFELLTSEYWLSKEDLIAEEFEGTYEKVEQPETVN